MSTAAHWVCLGAALIGLRRVTPVTWEHERLRNALADLQKELTRPSKLSTLTKVSPDGYPKIQARSKQR